MIAAKEQTISASGLRAMVAILRLSDAGLPVTVRSVCKAAGLSYIRRTQLVLRELHRAGVITSVPKRAGTIRPTYRMTIYTQALP